jgi:type I restriction enzyme S subunit
MNIKWNEKKLSDIATMIDYRGKTPQKSTSGIPLITAKIVKNGTILPANEFIAESQYASWMTRGDPCVGDVVMTTEAPLGEVAQLRDAHVALAQRIITIRGKKDVLDNGYLKYFLQSAEGQGRLRARETGTTVTGIKAAELRELMIPFPNIVQQRKISKVLLDLDEKIYNLRQENHNLEEQAKAIFKSWFVDFSALEEQEFFDNNGAIVPAGWEVSCLTNIADYLNGLAMQKYRPDEGDVGYPVLKIKELRQGMCDRDSERCSTISVKPEYIVHDGDVIFSWSGSLLVDFWCSGDCGLNQHLFKVTSSKFDKWFYYSWTQYHLHEFIAIAADKATTMGHIKRENLQAATVLVPPRPVYNEIGKLLGPIYESIIRNRVEAKRLAQLRDTLLPKLMAGEIDVSEVEV